MTEPISTSTSTRADRPWYKKKRYNIPLGIVVGLFLIGLFAPAETESGDDAKPAAAAAPDADKDGVSDKKDAFPQDPDESEDVDGNGVGDNADAAAAKKAADAKAKKAAAAKAKKEAAAKKKAEEKRKAKIANAPFASERELAMVFKDPDAHVGEMFKVWGEVTQFDSATGPEAFLASTAHADTRSYGFFEGENAAFVGSAKRLKKLIQDDIFVATVTVEGSLSYDTQIGGNTTVPQFKVLKVSRK